MWKKIVEFVISLFKRATVPPILGNVVFITDEDFLAHVRYRHALMVERISRKAPQLVVNRTWGGTATTPREGRLSVFPYPNFPEPYTHSEFALWFEEDRVIAMLPKFFHDNDVLDHELGHDITNSKEHAPEIFSGNPPQLTV